MILRSRNEIVTVKVDGSRVEVAGRAYESAHIMILGADGLEMSVTPHRVYVNAKFQSLPEIQDSTPHLLRIAKPDSTLRLDLEGSTIRNLKGDRDLHIEAELLTVKFESSELNDKVILRIPRLEPLGVERLVVESTAPSTLNAITDPFIVGVLSIEPRRAATLHVEKGREAVLKVD